MAGDGATGTALFQPQPTSIPCGTFTGMDDVDLQRPARRLTLMAITGSAETASWVRIHALAKGMDAWVFPTPQAALAELTTRPRSRHYHALITDVEYPEMDGLEAVALARQALTGGPGARMLVIAVRNGYEIDQEAFIPWPWAFHLAATQAGANFAVEHFTDIRYSAQVSPGQRPFHHVMEDKLMPPLWHPCQLW